ncbi:hypothetical protein ACOKXV_11445, partial [Sporosarcina psychrophila]|uniref:hypothetical protein n=1 Tax=Sporosarcina psychrophila TaxID=1476 RepID=UPI003BA39298
MTEKVKLTQEVADAIDYALNKGRYDHESLILSHAETELQDNPWTQAYKPLNEISLLKMVDALRIGFEVEPVFKPGQKVMVLWSGHGTEEMYEVVECDGDYVKIENGSDFNSAPVDIVRLATPEEIKVEKERRVWAGIGR